MSPFSIQTYSGLVVNPFDLKPEDIRIVDIAHALSNQCRFTGHTKRFYSVAEHATHCSRVVDQQFTLRALLHDASEAYLHDIASPIKKHRYFDEYRDLESDIEYLIYDVFKIVPTIDSRRAVKAADSIMLRREAEYLLAPLNPELWLNLESIPTTNIHIPCYGPREAEAKFLDTFWLLLGKKSLMKEEVLVAPI